MIIFSVYRTWVNLIVCFGFVGACTMCHASEKLDDISEAIMDGEVGFDDAINELESSEKCDVALNIVSRGVGHRSWKAKNVELFQRALTFANNSEFLPGMMEVALRNSMKPANGRQREGLFNVASLFKNDEMIDLIGNYLFDDRDFAEYDEDGKLNIYRFAPRNSFMAALALEKMIKGDGPFPDKHPDSYDYDDISKWRAWWIKKNGGLEDSASDKDQSTKKPTRN